MTKRVPLLTLVMFVGLGAMPARAQDRVEIARTQPKDCPVGQWLYYDQRVGSGQARGAWYCAEATRPPIRWYGAATQVRAPYGVDFVTSEVATREAAAVFRTQWTPISASPTSKYGTISIFEKYGAAAGTGTLRGSDSAFENWGSGAVTQGNGQVHWAFQFGAGTITHLRGASNYAFSQGAGTITNAYGTYSSVELDPGAGTVTNAYGAYSSVLRYVNGTVGTAYGQYIVTEGMDDANTSATYGSYIHDLQVGAGGTMWSYYANDPAAPSNFKGNIKLGDAAAPAKPSCNATNRGFIWHVYNGAGVADTIEVCRKTSTDTYGWQSIEGSGPPTEVVLSDGTPTSPSLRYLNDTTLGLHRRPNGILAMADNGYSEALSHRTPITIANRVVQTWTGRSSAADNVWKDVAWSPELGLFAAVAETGTGNRVMTSPDGVTWTIRTSAADNAWHGIDWSPKLGLFAAVSQNGVGNRVMTSPDGVTWTSRTSAADRAWDGLAWSPELGIFAAVSWTGTGDRVMTSAALNQRWR